MKMSLQEILPQESGAMVAVDLFAGAGGYTEGAEMAGCVVAWAANHWAQTVEVHRANHPQAIHACQDLQQADWAALPAHNLLLASPSCTGHTPARGKEKARHDSARSTAWAVVSCLEYHLPEFFSVENVDALLRWILFPAWKIAVQDLGYQLALHIRDAADHGVPQHRKRLFIVGVRAKHALKLEFEDKPHVPASSFLNFDSGVWSPIEKPGRAAKTLERVRAGRREFGDRFLMPYYGSGSGLKGRSIDRPIGTITTKDRWALVDGDRMRMLTKEENRDAMGFRKSYLLPDNHQLAVHMLGNAVPPPMARDVIQAIKRAA